MTCSDVQRSLPEFLDGAPDASARNGASQTAFETHLKSCPDCADLVSDLNLIASSSRELAAAEEPSPQVWLRIAAQLRAEGVIREQEPATAGRPILVPAFPSSARRWWSAWWLAPVAASLLVAGYVVNRAPLSHAPVNAVPAQQVAKQVTPPPAKSTVAETPATTVASQPASTSEQIARTSNPIVMAKPAAEPALEPEPSADDQQFLSVVSTNAPSMRAAYHDQLQAVNTDIRQAQNYLDHNPGDWDARQELMDAYQKKALLYQIAMDRIQ